MDDGTSGWRDPARGSREQRIEGMILEYQGRHEGRTPSQKEIAAAVGGSLRDVPAEIRRVKERLAAREARDRALPEMPEDLERMVAEFRQEVWQRACQHGDVAAAALRSRRAADEAEWEEERKQFGELIGAIEDERDVERKRAEAAEARLGEMEEREADAITSREEILREIEVLKARLAGRDEILEALRVGAGPRAGAEPKSKPARSAKRDEPSADDGDPAMEGTPGFEPQELPMGLSAQPRVG